MKGLVDIHNVLRIQSRAINLGTQPTWNMPPFAWYHPMGWLLGILVCSILLVLLRPRLSRPRLAVVNRYRWDWFQTKAKNEFTTRAQELIDTGLRHSAVFEMETNMGARVVISDKFADAVGACDQLDQHRGITPVGNQVVWKDRCKLSNRCRLTWQN